MITFEEAKIEAQAATIATLEHEIERLMNLRIERHEYDTMKSAKEQALEHYRRVLADNGRLRECLRLWVKAHDEGTAVGLAIALAAARAEVERKQ